MNISRLLKNILRYGLLLGLALCLYTTLMWLTQLDTRYLATGQYLDIVVVLLPIGFMSAAIRQHKRRQGYLGAGQRIAVSVGIGHVAELLYRPYLYAYHTRLNPEWFSAVLALKRTELMAAGRSAQNITTELARLQATHARPAGMFAGWWVSAFVLPALIALLTLLFLRNQSVKTQAG
ncbi:DUF4199 family protein [Hymenobacter sp. GOD-10R]|uniref:DUF4199 family protein n=1 Tax=Hymenobacter sp. GOD-10R TaxID=3093922 RepID=UPI002D7684B8|nr:DUF4199 family protein [Hymenobacter sp. GOD-10R]WRQ31805.1 DUF4199 family protein [Hymenobacter sp. GOD-10R]